MFSTGCSNELETIPCPLKKVSYCRRAYCPFYHEKNPNKKHKFDISVENNTSNDSIFDPSSFQNDLNDSYKNINKLNDLNLKNEFLLEPLKAKKIDEISLKHEIKSSSKPEEKASKRLSDDVPEKFTLPVVSLPKKSMQIDSDNFYGKKFRKENLPTPQQFNTKELNVKNNLESEDKKSDFDFYSLKRKGNIKPNLRLKVIRKLQAEYHKIGSENPIKSGEIAEQDFFNHYSTKQSYIGGCMGFILNLRKNSNANSNKSNNDSNINESENVSVMPSKLLKMKNAAIEKDKNLFKDFNFENILSLIASIDELAENGYPIYSQKNDSVSIKPSIYHKDLKKGQLLGDNDEVCIRCFKIFSKVSDLELINSLDYCNYHPEKLNYSKVTRAYRCCQQSKGSVGCKMALYHVFISDPDISKFSTIYDGNLFVSAEQNYANTEIYAMDCEMVYTTAGYELARLSVVDKKLETVIDVFVKPSNPIIDYNTEFSGLNEEIIKNSSDTLESAKEKLKNLLNKSEYPPILIGHSLENDLIALQTYYYNIIDTSLVFLPTQAGYKFKLRNLANQYLKKLIQSNLEGHDSVQDSVIAMELVAHKLCSFNNLNKM